MTMALEDMRSPCDMSLTLRLIKSQPRNLLSNARLNNASSLTRFESYSLILMAQMSLILSGAFCPMSLPLFHEPKE